MRMIYVFFLTTDSATCASQIKPNNLALIEKKTGSRINRENQIDAN